MTPPRLSPAVVEIARAELVSLSAAELAARHTALRARVASAVAGIAAPEIEMGDPAPYSDPKSAGGRWSAAVRQAVMAEGAEGLALAALASERTLGYAPRENQVATAVALLSGRAVDLATGEGKTLAAALAASLLAAAGRGVHVATANSYLAERDAAWMAPLYQALGLDAKPITGAPGSASRRAGYLAPISYATAEGLAYDGLHDGHLLHASHRIRRAPFALILDEADSLLIDLARAPITMTRPIPADEGLVREMAAFVTTLPDEDGGEPGFTIDPVFHTAGPTDAGAIAAVGRFGDFYSENSARARAFQLAIEARALFERDRDYLVIDGQIAPVDRRTGRASRGRFRGGLSVALAAKEGLAIPAEDLVTAETTIPALVSTYALIAAMSGSAAAAAEELGAAYGLTLERIAPHRPSVRIDAPDRLFADTAQALAGAVDAAATASAAGRPVLIGALDVAAAEQVSVTLARAGIAHDLLTARDHAREAEILADAGAPGKVTVSAAIAGRGVDIILGGRADQPDFASRRATAIAAGGLAIIGLGRHDERRLDEQLKGRSGRAGDPGSSVFYLSADDRLFRAVGADRLRRLLSRLGHGKRALFGKAIDRSVAAAQTRLGGLSIDARKALRMADEPFARQRTIIAAERARILEGADPVPTVRDALVLAARAAVTTATVAKAPADWDLRGLSGALIRLGIREDEIRQAAADMVVTSAHQLSAAVESLVDRAIARRLGELGDYAAITLRIAVLMAVDRIYEEHLSIVADLRTAKSLRIHGAGRASTGYMRDLAHLYDEYREQLAREIARTALHVTPSRRGA